MKQLFLYVKNEDVKNKLLANKYTLLKEEMGYYVFANDGILKFSENDKKELLFSKKIN